MSIYQISVGSIDVEQELGDVLNQAYSLGERNAGGGVIGTLVAIPFIKMFGMLGTVILALGITVVFLVFIFGFKPTEFISDFLYDMQEKKNEKKEEKVPRESRIEERKASRGNRIYNVEEDIDIPVKETRETRKERKLREAEEKKRQALEVDQLTINNIEEVMIIKMDGLKSLSIIKMI